jgi:hypothetical protein
LQVVFAVQNEIVLLFYALALAATGFLGVAVGIVGD